MSVSSAHFKPGHPITDVAKSIMVKGIVTGGVVVRRVYRNTEWVVDTSTSKAGDVGYAFVWIDPVRLNKDLREILAAAGAEI